MRKFVTTALAIGALGFVPIYADDPTEEEAAQLTGSCGEIKNRNTSYQFGTGLWLEYIAETARPLNTFDCPWLSVSVEAHVVGVPGSASSSWGGFVASVRRQIPVPNEGEWQTNSNHYRNYLWLFSYWHGTLSSMAMVKRSDEQPPPDNSGYGGECGGDPEAPCETASSNGGDSASPIVIDVDGNGYHLTSVDDGVRFDLDADGVAELVAWTRADSGDAFLAFDRNGNGRIDDGSELFGNHTPAFPGRMDITAANGFEALRFLEGPAYGRAARDEVLTARDDAFSKILLWTDRNHNGFSEPDELQPAAAAGLLAIETDYQTARRRDAFGNEFRQRAKVIWPRGEAFAYDVWLRRRL